MRLTAFDLGFFFRQQFHQHFASYVVLGFGDQFLEVSQVFPVNELIYDEHIYGEPLLARSSRAEWPPRWGAWGRVRAGVIWRNIAEASNDVRLQAHHIRFACAVLFCSLSEFATDQIGTRAGLRLMTEADIATLGIQNTHRSQREPPRGSVETHLWREPIDAEKSWSS